MIETVGVGQDEVDIVRLADVTIVVLVPGMGDDVQTIKAGIMEIADIFVINKSDRDGAERVEREIRAMQAITPKRSGAGLKDDWIPPIVKTVASSGAGIDELVATIEKYRAYLGAERPRDDTAHRKLADAHCRDAARRAVPAGAVALHERQRRAAIRD